jgi:hypothetical protein
MTVRRALKMYVLIGLPVTLLAVQWVAQWHRDTSVIPVLVFVIVGMIILRCPRCHKQAGWTRFAGPLAPPMGAPFMPKSCTWCGLNFETARLTDQFPPFDPDTAAD